MAANHVWSFTTGIAPDTTPPAVSSTDPSNGVTGVALNKKIDAIFTEALDPLTINTATFLLKQGLTPVAGTVSYVGTTATFSPAVALAPNTTYTATILGIKDLAGNLFVNNYVWSFTTAGAVLDTTAAAFSGISGCAS